MKKLSVLGFAALIAFGCTRKSTPTASATPSTPAAAPAVASTPKMENPTPPPVTSENPTDQPKKFNMTLIASGEKVYNANCGRCHSLKAPADYTQERWVKLVDWMAPKARLTEKEKEQCLAYVQYNAKDAPKDKSKM